MPKDRRRRLRTGRRTLAATTDLPNARALKPIRAHLGIFQPFITRSYHFKDSRSKALLWSAKRSARSAAMHSSDAEQVSLSSAITLATCLSTAGRAGPKSLAQRGAGSGEARGTPSRCLNARLMLGPQLPPDLDAWSALSSGTANGPMTPASAAPNSLLRQVGS